MNELALFAGAGGGILGGHLLGWRTVCAVEFDAYARDVLIARQRDGCLPRFPIWDDVRTFEGNRWRGSVDVVSGGFPCQDISSAGRGAGIEGKRSGLWKEMARIVGEVRPRFVWVENSPLLVSRGLAVVLGDLASMGYDARWGVVGAHNSGANHERDRIWILANSNSAQRKGRGISCGVFEKHPNACGSAWWSAEPKLGRVADGMAAGVDIHGTHAGLDVGRVATGIQKRGPRLKCIGNGQVPAAMILAWEILNSL